ncbi:UNVERIFIED_CONTAM: hypothetical protein HDU68_008159 [Siphonaria sp. JEL0065]|nr:hypothetical protein HDU68_008159 [Siphonaria sp. JEL0065]
MAAPSLFDDYMQQAEMQVELESLYSASSCNSAVEYQQPFDFLPAGSDITLEPDMFSYFCNLPEIDSSMLSLNMPLPINMPVNMNMTMNAVPLMLDGGFAYAPAPTDYYYSPSPSPTLALESPFASASLKSPPHSPNPTCLPLSFVAPSPAPLFLDQTPSSSYSPLAPDYHSLKSVKKSAAVKRPNATAAALKPLLLKDFLKAQSPITIECSDSEFDTVSVEPLSPSKSDGQVTPSPIRRTSSSKKSSSSAIGKKRHILKEWETEILNLAFEENQFLQTNQATQLAERLGMTPNQVRIWFQNRRAYVKRMNSSKTNDDSQDD